jgi:sorting nexin-17
MCVVKGYKLNINGEYHCTVRYRQLHSLNDLLKRICEGLPHFPPKKYWPLSANQIEERRSLLEKYIQTGKYFIIITFLLP